MIENKCNLKDSSKFSKSFNINYANELQLKCEHHGLHATFLDLSITDDDDIYEYKLYDKRNSYPFFIICIPDLSGSIPAYFFMGQFYLSFLE